MTLHLLRFLPLKNHVIASDMLSLVHSCFIAEKCTQGNIENKGHFVSGIDVKNEIS